MAYYGKDPEKPKKTYVIIKCKDEQEAKQTFDRIIDEFDEVWPYLAYDDGFGHLVKATETG